MSYTKDETGQTVEGDLWTILESPPAGCEAVADLYRWSTNYDRMIPFVLWLDLIGYTGAEYGEASSDWPTVLSCLGYMELDYIGAALVAHADRPTDTYLYASALLAAEVNA